MRLLVVEDAEDVADAIAGQLSRLGHVCDKAGTIDWRMTRQGDKGVGLYRRVEIAEQDQPRGGRFVVPSPSGPSRSRPSANTVSIASMITAGMANPGRNPQLLL